MKSAQTQDTIDRIVDQCIAVRLRRLNRVVTNIYDQALRPMRLKVSQLNILVAAAKMGLARPTHLCKVLQLDPSTLSRNVDRMKARGWVEIVESDDARTQSFRLTASGLRLLERAAPAWERAQNQVSQMLGEPALAALHRLIPDLTAA